MQTDGGTKPAVDNRFKTCSSAVYHSALRPGCPLVDRRLFVSANSSHPKDVRELPKKAVLGISAEGCTIRRSEKVSWSPVGQRRLGRPSVAMVRLGELAPSTQEAYSSKARPGILRGNKPTCKLWPGKWKNSHHMWSKICCRTEGVVEDLLSVPRSCTRSVLKVRLWLLLD